jgi:hypothetical protein
MTNGQIQLAITNAVNVSIVSVEPNGGVGTRAEATTAISTAVPPAANAMDTMTRARRGRQGVGVVIR